MIIYLQKQPEWCAHWWQTATNEHTIPNGRGEERLNHERREQLQHQRRGNNDRIAPPPCHLKITQWNVQGLSNKRHTVQAAKNIDINNSACLDTNSTKRAQLPWQHDSRQGDHPQFRSRTSSPWRWSRGASCSDTPGKRHSLVVYNIYKPPPKRLEAGELLTQATQKLVLIAGDFNAHHRTINPTTTMNQDVDLTFTSTELIPVAQWEVDDELTSDHFATTTTLRMELLPPPPGPPPRWNTKKANWKLCHQKLKKWYSNYEPAEDIGQLNQDFTDAIQHAAEEAIPKKKLQIHTTETTGSTMTRFREQNHRINTFRRHLRQYPSSEGVKLLRAAVQHTRQITQIIWEDKWLDLRKLRIATGKLPRAPAHPQPLQEANRLAEHFAERSTTS
ncbi:putative pol-like 35 [Homarus americanus]|uniref:Putative pol-like 35 n=1 Tax=Homarus americanus TaxID=6706 RepID=A0A8J5JJQ2_HOMAM|nr:putative pol-like 35 [Homarus americanus]